MHIFQRFGVYGYLYYGSEIHQVGMQAKDPRLSVPGSGLAFGYTTSPFILIDAVALIRGDRFLTFEYTREHLCSEKIFLSIDTFEQLSISSPGL